MLLERQQQQQKKGQTPDIIFPALWSMAIHELFMSDFPVCSQKAGSIFPVHLSMII